MIEQVLRVLDDFDSSLGNAPGGQIQAFNYWIKLSEMLDGKEFSWDSSAAGLQLSRPGWIALLRYALNKRDWTLAMTATIAGAHNEGKWTRPLDNHQLKD